MERKGKEGKEGGKKEEREREKGNGGVISNEGKEGGQKDKGEDHKREIEGGLQKATLGHIVAD